MSMVQQAIEVSAPLHTVYEQLAAFENYPRFMSGVHEVTPIGADQTHWIMDVGGRRREFDALITERSVDERVSWATVDGPLLAETITLRPMGETRTQVVAQLEADIAFLAPSDRHGQASLTKRLKNDLTAFKSLVETGEASGRPRPGGPKKAATPSGTTVDTTAAPGIRTARDHDDETAAAGRAGAAGRVPAGAGTAEMGGRPGHRDPWGDGLVNEEERGSAHDM